MSTATHSDKTLKATTAVKNRSILEGDDQRRKQRGSKQTAVAQSQEENKKAGIWGKDS